MYRAHGRAPYTRWIRFMAKRKITNLDRGPALVPDVPSVDDIIQGLNGRRGAILAALKDMTASLPGVEEKAVYDGFCQEWTPAYYLESPKARRQLFHVHDFPAGLRGTIFVGVNTLQPVLLDAGLVPPRMKSAIMDTPGGRTKQVRVPLNNLRYAAAFFEMVRVKWEFEHGRLGL